MLYITSVTSTWFKNMTASCRMVQSEMLFAEELYLRQLFYIYIYRKKFYLMQEVGLKIKSGFMLRNIADNWIVVPIGERVVDFNGLITLNDTGAFLWNILKAGSYKDNLIVSLKEEFDVDNNTASTDVNDFLTSLEKGGLLEE